MGMDKSAMLVEDPFEVPDVVRALELFPSYDPEVLLIKYREKCKCNGTKLI